MEPEYVIPTKFFIKNYSGKPIKFLSRTECEETAEIIFPKVGSKISTASILGSRRNLFQDIIAGRMDTTKYSVIIIKESHYPKRMLAATENFEGESNIIIRHKDPEDPGVENLTKDVPGGIVWITFREPRPDDVAKKPFECQVKPEGLGIYYESFRYNESGRCKSFSSCFFPKGLALDHQEELLQEIEEFVDWLVEGTIILDGHMCPPLLLDKIRERFLC